MTANELADELEKSLDLWFKDKTVGQWVVKTLRKQEENYAEISVYLIHQIMENKKNDRLL
jgi:hypothetical protein